MLSSYFKKDYFQILIQHIALCTIKHVGHFKKAFLKMILFMENCPFTVLKHCVEFYKILESGLTLFGCIMQKLQKK
jgi:hypothetical protein